MSKFTRDAGLHDYKPESDDSVFSVSESIPVGDDFETKPIARLNADGTALFRERPLTELTRDELIEAIGVLLRAWAQHSLPPGAVGAVGIPRA